MIEVDRELKKTLEELEVGLQIFIVLLELMLGIVGVDGEWKLKVRVNQKLVVVMVVLQVVIEHMNEKLKEKKEQKIVVVVDGMYDGIGNVKGMEKVRRERVVEARGEAAGQDSAVADPD